MPLKSRTESEEMKILRILNTRMELAPDDKKRYLNQKKGYEGEVMFDELTAGLDSKFYILNDLQLEHNTTSFQIDSLFISQHTLIPFEIKNFEGNYYFENDNFYYSLTGKKISNPLHQLNRGETYLHQLLHNKGFHIHVEGNLSFINPQFYLYKAPFNKKIIYPTQHQRLLKNLEGLPSKLNKQHLRIADFLIQSHKPSPTRLPPYTYEQLQKGPTCKKCQSFFIIIGDKKIICTLCGEEESIEASVIRSVGELKLLFPNIKINANTVIEWCRMEDHKRKVRRILLKNYQKIGHGKYSYYINK